MSSDSFWAERPPYAFISEASSPVIAADAAADQRWMPIYSERWVKHFIMLAETVARQSKDPSTKVGAVIVDNRKRVVGMGYNGFPDRVEDNPGWLKTRETKLALVVHAEVNAILNAVGDVQGCDLFCTHQLCAECMKFLIQAGIRRVYHPTVLAGGSLKQSWLESVGMGVAIAELAGVAVLEVHDYKPPLVYIESPYSGDIESNTHYVRACMADSIQRGEAPFASHALYTQVGVLDDTDPAQRARGMANGFAWGRYANLTAVYVDLGLSQGMMLGIEDAKRHGRRVVYRSIFNSEQRESLSIDVDAP